MGRGGHAFEPDDRVSYAGSRTNGEGSTGTVIAGGSNFYVRVAWDRGNPSNASLVDGDYYPGNLAPLQPEPEAELPTTSPRAEILDEAKRLITQERNNQYGPPTQDFVRWAGAAQAMGYRAPGGRDMAGHDLSILMALLKISRLTWTPEKADSWIDLAGYAGCGYEVATEK